MPTPPTPEIFPTRILPKTEKGIRQLIGELSSFIQRHPLAMNYNLRGELWEEVGDLERALGDYRMATSLEPECPDHWIKRSLACTFADNDDAALSACEMGLKHCVRDHTLECLAVLSLLKLDRVSEAIEEVEHAANEFPEIAFVYHCQGLALISGKRYSDAVCAFTRALDLDPTGTNSQRDRGRALFYDGQYAAALGDFSSLLQANPTDAMLAKWVSKCKGKLNGEHAPREGQKPHR